MSQPAFSIDLNEQFETLAHPPIVEAVMQWRATPQEPLNAELLLAHVRPHLTDYNEPQPQHQVEMRMAFSPDGSSEQRNKSVWQGFRFASKDDRFVAQFTREAFTFSRIHGYDDWSQFETEACRLWDAYRELAQPEEIQRLGVRFINQIPIDSMEELPHVLAEPPRSPAAMSLPIGKSLQRTLFDIPGHPYRLNVICATQPANPPDRSTECVILDLDVSTTGPVRADDPRIEEHRTNMRWVKNKAFHSFLTSEAIDSFKE